MINTEKKKLKFLWVRTLDFALIVFEHTLQITAPATHTSPARSLLDTTVRTTTARTIQTGIAARRLLGVGFIVVIVVELRC
jgi:hypothetical protein